MPSSLRKLMGTLALLALVAVYVLAAMVVAAAILPGAGRIAEFSFYAIAGLAWVPLAGLIITWMHKSPSNGG